MLTPKHTIWDESQMRGKYNYFQIRPTVTFVTQLLNLIMLKFLFY